MDGCNYRASATTGFVADSNAAGKKTPGAIFRKTGRKSTQW